MGKQAKENGVEASNDHGVGGTRDGHEGCSDRQKKYKQVSEDI